MKTTTLFCVALFVICPITAMAQDEPTKLRNNPISRPASDFIVDDRIFSMSDESVSATLELQATMIGSVNKLANVGGQIIKPGDEIQGHVLVSIHERYAVFSRNGELTTVYVKPELAKDDE